MPQSFDVFTNKDVICSACGNRRRRKRLDRLLQLMLSAGLSSQDFRISQLLVANLPSFNSFIRFIQLFIQSLFWDTNWRPNGWFTQLRQIVSGLGRTKPNMMINPLEFFTQILQWQTSAVMPGRALHQVMAMKHSTLSLQTAPSLDSTVRGKVSEKIDFINNASVSSVMLSALYKNREYPAASFSAIGGTKPSRVIIPLVFFKKVGTNRYYDCTWRLYLCLTNWQPNSGYLSEMVNDCYCVLRSLLQLGGCVELTPGTL